MPSASHSVVIADGPKQSFARMLIRQGHPLAAVRETGGKRLFLGVDCKSTADAERRSCEIALALMTSEPELRHLLQLGPWMARKLERRLLLFWPSVELVTLH